MKRGWPAFVAANLLGFAWRYRSRRGSRCPRGGVLVWVMAVILTSAAGLTSVFSSFLAIKSLSNVIAYAGEPTAQRYILPLLLGWLVIVLLLLFGERPQETVGPKQRGGKARRAWAVR